jgi:hypothetical protein
MKMGDHLNQRKDLGEAQAANKKTKEAEVLRNTCTVKTMTSLTTLTGPWVNNIENMGICIHIYRVF